MRHFTRAMIVAASMAALVAGEAHAQPRHDIRAITLAAVIGSAGNSTAVEEAGPSDDIVVKRHDEPQAAVMGLGPKFQQLCIGRKAFHHAAVARRKPHVSPWSCTRR